MSATINEEIWHLINFKRFDEVKVEISSNVIDVNYQYNGGASLLHCAASAGAKEIIQILIEKGADIEIKDSCGNTPLMKAISAYNFKDDSVIRLLISLGANIDAQNNYNVTIREFAKTKGYVLEGNNNKGDVL